MAKLAGSDFGDRLRHRLHLDHRSDLHFHQGDLVGFVGFVDPVDLVDLVEGLGLGAGLTEPSSWNWDRFGTQSLEEWMRAIQVQENGMEGIG